jgi:predicted amidophosphoribosyltransferase
MGKSENPTNIPAENACNIGAKDHMTVIPGLCPNCGSDVKIEMKNCPECDYKLGYKD